MLEPGLDRHEWESRWQSLEEELEDSPRDVLPELDELVEQMLNERGYAIDDPVAREAMIGRSSPSSSPPTRSRSSCGTIPMRCRRVTWGRRSTVTARCTSIWWRSARRRN
jgi:hypothetical protein